MNTAAFLFVRVYKLEVALAGIAVSGISNNDFSGGAG